MVIDCPKIRHFFFSVTLGRLIGVREHRINEKIVGNFLLTWAPPCWLLAGCQSNAWGEVAKNKMADSEEKINGAIVHKLFEIEEQVCDLNAVYCYYRM